jgi:hypothetical protein
MLPGDEYIKIDFVFFCDLQTDQQSRARERKMSKRTLYSPWTRFTKLDEKQQDCMAYIQSYGPYISMHAWENVLKHRRGPGAGRGFVVVDLSTERDKSPDTKEEESETRMAFIPVNQFVDHGCVPANFFFSQISDFSQISTFRFSCSAINLFHHHRS